MNALRQKRLERGLLQRQLAAEVGCSRTAISGWERGLYKPTAGQLPKLEEALGCRAEELGLTSAKRKTVKPVQTEEEKAIQIANQEKAAPYIERRIALGLSKKELAQKAGVDVSTVRSMEMGRHYPRWETRQKLRRVLSMPEERSYTEEERNRLFFEIDTERSIYWLIWKNRDRIYRVHMDADDLYQDLAVCALRAIDRFQPDRKATLKTFVERNMAFLLEKKLVQFCMHGLSGKLHYPLPNITVFSLEALMEDGLQLEDYDCDFEYDEENRPRCCEHQGRQVAVAV